MAHYFEYDPNMVSNKHEVRFEILGKNFSLMSDNGVFSKSELDDGTRTLIETSFNHRLNGSVLDLGCGIGTVGLVLKSLLDELHVEMVDVQHNAVELAKENIKRLKLEGIEATDEEYRIMLDTLIEQMGKSEEEVLKTYDEKTIRQQIILKVCKIITHMTPLIIII